MECPKCKKGVIVSQESITGWPFKKKRVKYYCPLCDWENQKEFRLSQEDVEIERLRQTNLPKRSEKTYTYKNQSKVEHSQNQTEQEARQ